MVQTFRHKVIIHKNLLKSRKTLIDAVYERSHGVLFTCPESDLLVDFNHVSVYEYNRTKNLMIGP